MNILAVDHNAILSADRALYRRLSEMKDVKLTLVVPERWKAYYGNQVAESEGSALRVIACPAFFAGKSHRAFYPTLKSLVKKFQPDILYVEAEPESYLAWQAVRLQDNVSSKTKVVFMSWRNIDYTGGRFPYKLSFLNARAERRVLARANSCIAHIKAAQEIFSRKGFDSVTVIPPAIDITMFRKIDAQELRKRLGLHFFTIGYVGRFIPEKGVACLLKAASSLQFKYQLVLLGDGPAKREWKQLSQELKIEQHIVWIDPQPHQKIAEYINALDVLVLPSYRGSYWQEQFGRVLIEAMACEVPVIGSNSGEIPNVIGDAGLIFHERNSDDMKQQLCMIHDDVLLRKRLISKGIERVQQKFSVESIAQQYYETMRKLLI